MVGAEPVITLNVANDGNSAVNGSVSCLIRPAGGSDTNWVARAPAVPIVLKGGSTQEITLSVTAGSLDTAGTYELVVFLRQDIGGLSHETRVQFPDNITVK